MQNDSLTFKYTIGVDIGNVICQSDTDDPKNSKVPLIKQSAIEVPGAIDSLKRLNEKYDVHLVSKVGVEMEKKTIQWLSDIEFSKRTGITSWHFCRDRWDKAPICKRLSVQAFVDDRIEVLKYMFTDVPHLFLFNDHTHKDSRDYFARSQHIALISKDWRRVEDHIKALVL